MTEFIHLIGAEDVQRAGNNMKSAADTMQNAANIITEALENTLDSWMIGYIDYKNLWRRT